MLRHMLALGCLLAILGCGSAEMRRTCYPVKGQLFVNGVPAGGAKIDFYPINMAEGPKFGGPTAFVDASGNFQLTTYDLHDGAPVGKYAVTVIWPDKSVPLPPGEEDPAAAPDLLGGRYASPVTTNLEIEIKEGPNELEPLNIK